MSSSLDEESEAHDRSHAELRTQLELLAEENERLRSSYTQAKQTQYRRTAIGLVAIGGLAAIGGLLVPAANEVLFVLSAIGAFGGMLTYYLTPEQFVAANVGRDVFTSLSANEQTLTEELGLSEHRRYVPIDDGQTVRLFVPQHEDAPLPPDTELDRLIVATESTRGVALTPSGSRLFEAVENATSGAIDTSLPALADLLTDAIVEQFELAETATAELDTETGRLTVAVTDSAFGDVARFDHPIPSLLAVGLAATRETPIVTTTEETPDGNTEYLITCRWDVERTES